ncbi:menaquinone biosynthesis protein [Nitrospirota bacterium]
MSEPLRVGRISYLNLLPIFSALEELADPGKYNFMEGVPSELNRMLRNGELDISPSSSIEYLRDKNSYQFLKGHSISSTGAVRSVLLFSRIPIENICSQKVMATHQSETSIALLRVILNKFYGHDCDLETTREPFYEAIRRHSAYLSIGDDALMALHESNVLEIEKPADCHAICSISNQAFYVYDLGELWRMHTGLPSVYALWTYRASLPDERIRLIEAYGRDLASATDNAMKNIERIAMRSDVNIPPAEAVAYWRGITYGLPDKCLEGLSLFEKYLYDTGVLD